MNLQEINCDVHIAYHEGRKSKRTVAVFHQHVRSCVFHQYNPITGCTVRVDVLNGPNKSKQKRKFIPGFNTGNELPNNTEKEITENV